MAKQLTRAQFRAQFKHPVSFEDITPVFDRLIHGYRLFRALNLLVIEDGGTFYAAHL